MTNYAVTDWVSSISDAVTIMAEVEAYLETVTDSKTILMSGTLDLGGGICQAYIVHLA